MITKIFLKEWKERINIFIFSMTIFILFALITLKFSGQKEFHQFFPIFILSYFLPFIAILIGSNGFYSEFRDDAWTYIFSRPIKKWIVWLTKYFSQLTILISVILIFLLITLILPELREAMESYSIFRNQENLYLISWSILFYGSLFTIAFSISFLYEKPFIIFLSAILIRVFLAYFFTLYQELLQKLFPIAENLRGLSLLWPLSFILASIFAFNRSDFSQMKEKIFMFSKFAILFLILSLLISSAWTIGSKYLFGNNIYIP